MDNNFIDVLKERFDSHMDRHPDVYRDIVFDRLNDDEKLYDTVFAMEETLGEPDVIDLPSFDGLAFVDMSRETPKGRLSLCYDKIARTNRKKNAPLSSALEEAHKIGITLLDETQYYEIARKEEIDLKTSSWIFTGEDIRSRGGALFCSTRYGRIFTYHNGADSYYASRGFRGYVKIHAD